MGGISSSSFQWNFLNRERIFYVRVKRHRAHRVLEGVIVAKMVSRLLAKHCWLGFVACLAIILASHNGGASAQHALGPKPLNNTSGDNQKWERVSYRGQTVVAVGSTRLLFPVVLPPHIKPLNNVGLFGRKSPDDYYVSFYFPLEQEGQVRNWYHDKRVRHWIRVSNILGKSHFGLGKWEERNYWRTSIWGITNGWRWALVAIGSPNDPTEKLSDFQWDQTVLKHEIALRQPGSPVQHARRLVSLLAGFRTPPSNTP